MSAIDLTPRAARAALGGLAVTDDDLAATTRYARAIWSAIVEPGDGSAGALIESAGVVESLRLLAAATGGDPPSRISDDFRRGLARWTPRLKPAVVSDALAMASRAGVRLVTPEDGEWPRSLSDLGDHAPVALWARGDTGILRRQPAGVAIVGARASTAYGDRIAAELATDLGTGGITIVSGAAYGIDGSAHRAALAVEGVTIALLAGGVEQAYPRGHTRLIDSIAQSGLLLSEAPCGSRPTKWRFLQRNRLIAAMSDATVVVEAGWRSGSLNTAGHAAALGRELGAVPGPVTSAASAGCHRLFREYGAQCITSADDVREMLGLRSAGAVGSDALDIVDDTARIFDALSARSWRSTDGIAQRCGMSRESVEAHLGLLLMTGLVERGTQGWRDARRA